MTLGVEDAALQPPVLALAHDPLHVFLEHLQVPEHNPFELAAALGIRRNRFHVLQRQGHVARKNLLAQRGGPPEAAVKELLDIAQTQILAAQNEDELLDILRADAVHAHELAHDPHIGINRKGAAEELFPNLGADLPQQAQPHAHPGFADREFGGDLRHTQVPDVFEFVEEPRLLEDTQTFVFGRAQQVQNPTDLVGPDRGIRRRVQAQFAGTAIALKSIEQNRRGLAPGGSGGQVNTFQRLLDATLGNRA